MDTQEFMKAVYCQTEENGKLEEYKKGLPIGKDEEGNIVLAQTREKTFIVRNTCVTGAGRAEFIRRLVITLSGLYEKNQACFFVLSPNTEYGELLRLQSIDVTVPYIRGKADLDLAIKTLEELLRIRSQGAGYPRLFLILDGLDELPDCNQGGELHEYRAICEMFMRKNDVDIISGLDLCKSIFVGYPGALLGVGNCLITTHEEGKADVTYVEEDSSLSLPKPIVYPSEPMVTESIVLLNSLSVNG